MSKVPAISHKAAIRSVICLFLLALLVLGYNWIRSWRDPDDFSNFDSSGMILALKSTDGGTQAVVLKPTNDGVDIWESPDYVAGKIDRDPAWRPDGGTIIFSSDRETDVYNLYRWNLMRNMVQRRSLGTRGQLSARFLPLSLGGTNDVCLITAGGSVQAFRADDGTTDQILPPIPRGASTVSETETGATVSNQFESNYSELGMSFREARWGPDRDWVLAVMRTQIGEVLIFQDMVKGGNPAPIIRAERIMFDVSPIDGTAIASAVKTQAQMKEKPTAEDAERAKQETKFRHVLVIVEPKKRSAMFATTQSDKEVWGQPAFSPDGTAFAVAIGTYEGSGNVAPKKLVVYRLSDPKNPIVVAEGNVSDPGWSPDGGRIVFVRNNGKERSICTVASSGGGEKNLTAGKGNFSSPRFSPRQAK